MSEETGTAPSGTLRRCAPGNVAPPESLCAGGRDLGDDRFDCYQLGMDLCSAPLL